MKLCNFCIRRPAFTTVLSLLLILIGTICYFKLPLRYLPTITVPIITISTDYPGASSRMVESQVTNILENAMSGLSRLRYMTSTSQDGNSQIVLTFRLGVSLDAAAADVRANVTKVLNHLPDNSDLPIVTKVDPNAQPILFLAYFNLNESIGSLTNYVRQYIVPQFEASPGVANVALWSSQYDVLQINVDPEKMAARNVTVSDVRRVLQTQNTVVPTGTLESNQLAYTLVTNLKIDRLDQFNNLVIKDDDNHVVALKDIAQVRIGNEHRTHETIMRYFAVNGKPGVAIGLIPETGTNDLAMTSSALELANKIATTLPSGMQQFVEYNQSNFTEAALHSVYEAIIEAFILVLLVIMFFLGNARASLIPIVTVPICLIGGFAVIYFLGYTINSITLLALVLAIGLVVDDAIVMLENISRYIDHGETPLSAAFKGAKQIAWPIISMTITLAGVYAPVGFSQGVSGVFFQEFAYTLLGTVLISGAVALTLSPMMCAKILLPKTTSIYSQWIDKKLNNLRFFYHQHITRWIRQRQWIALIMLALLLLGFGILSNLPKELAPKMNMPLLNLRVKTSPQNSYAHTQSFIPPFEMVLNNTPEIQGYLMQNWEHGSFYGVLALKPDQIRHSQQIAQRLQREFDNIPGTMVTVSVAAPPLTSFLASGQPGSLELNILTSDSYEVLNQVMQSLLSKAKNSPLFINSNTTLQWDTRQIDIQVNRDLAADLAIPMQAVTDTLQTLLGGIQVGRYDFNHQSFDVILQLPEQDLKTTNILNQLYVHSDKGEIISLKSLVRLNQRTGPVSLEHYNRLRSATLMTQFVPGVSMGAAVNHLEKIAKTTLPDNITFAFSGNTQQYLDSNHTIIWLFFLALIFIYLILVAQFESFIDPFIILSCVPFGLVGALIALKITGNSLNLYSEMALITLIGLIAKHGILITEFANQQMKEGKSATEAVITAASLRLRPILMTTTAMILGALPLALALGPDHESRQQIGWVIVGGLFFGTLISLVIVPIAFVTVKSFFNKKYLINNK